MQIRFLGKGGSEGGGCPSLYATDRNSYIVQGWRTDAPGIVEIPHLLLGFAVPDTFVGAMLTDTGRGTFLLSGSSVADPEVVGKLDVREGETYIEVPMAERTFYGAARAG
ncbi:hypothetical protein [Nocardia sp. CA-290969]|uniref:hypothetical protein n=1 Tax=Nocardia sp. CA-290969 TaxID=3239986 RepID=UPI003D942C7E